MDRKKFDTLSEYHLQNTHLRVGHMIEDIVDLLEQGTPEALEHAHIRIRELLAHLRNYFNSPALVAKELELDIEEATELLDQLNHVFTVEDPLEWIKGYILKFQKVKLSAKLKNDQLLGKYSLGQAEDTHEENRVRERIHVNIS